MCLCALCAPAVDETETNDLCDDISCDSSIDNTALDMLERLPGPFEIRQAEEILQMKLRSTDAVLLQELQLFNRLVERIRETLQLLRQVCIYYLYRTTTPSSSYVYIIGCWPQD